MIVLCSLICRPIGAEEYSLFPVPDGMALRIQFWINVFTLYSNNQMIIHDTDIAAMFMEEFDRIYEMRQ